MSIMKITDQSYFETINIIQTYKITDGFFGAEVNIYAIHEDTWDSPDIHEIEIEWFVNNKRTSHAGFEKMYTDLYGKADLKIYIKKIEALAEPMFLNKLKKQ